MDRLRNWILRATLCLFVLGEALITTACSTSKALPKGALGNPGVYNYSPSVIETGNIRQFWWCSNGGEKNTDGIYYQIINTSTLESYGPVLVLQETPGAWDAAYTCNPKVIGGAFDNPFGDGQNYAYAMYYVATSTSLGINNSIGVAFSHDGIAWRKYPQPVIPSKSENNFGLGQPTVYNADHKSAISLFYEDRDTPAVYHIAAVSNDGLHFKTQGTLTTNGLNPDNPQAVWGDMSFDPKAGEWYAVFNRPVRLASTTGGVQERGQYGIELYKIQQSALFTGATAWQQLVTMDTNMTGFESNFIAGFVHDVYGNLDVSSYPTIQMYTSISYPAPSWQATPAEAGESAGISTWILMPMKWVPSASPAVALSQYFNGTVHQATTGWASPDGGFQLQGVLGHLFVNPLHGATVPFYGCKGGQTDYFVSLDIGCEGQRILGTNGYGFSQPVPALNLVALYRCRTGSDHFVSTDPKCEGQATDQLLGYIAP